MSEPSLAANVNGALSPVVAEGSSSRVASAGAETGFGTKGSSRALNGGSYLAWALVAICVVYALQVFTPLRLDHDAIVLLSMAGSAADGHGFLYEGSKTHYLPTYPAIVVCMERLGVARSWGLIGLNVFFLFVGLSASGYTALRYFRLSNSWAIVTALLTSLSFPLIKYFTLPQTDIVFFGISLMAVAALVRAEREPGNKYYAWWASAVLLAVTALLMRQVGVALIAGLIWSISTRIGIGRVLRWNKRLLVVGCVVATLLVSVASFVLWRTTYVQGAISLVGTWGIKRSFYAIVRYRLREIGELAINTPANRLGPLSPLVWFVGLGACVMLIMLVRRSRLGSVEAYLATYAAILLFWPYGDPRFWIPVIPLIAAALLSSWQPWALTGWKRRLSLSYSAIYILMGVAALAYSTRITFSGEQFPFRYGNELRSTYEFFYYGVSSEEAAVNQPAIEVLERYSPRNAPRSSPSSSP